MCTNIRKIFILCIIFTLCVVGGYMATIHHNSPKTGRYSIIAPVKIVRLEQGICTCQTREEIAALLQDYPLLLSQFWGVTDSAHVSLIADKIYALQQHVEIKGLYKEVTASFRDLSALSDDLRYAFSVLQHYYPDFTPPQVITIVTGMDTDLYVSKELVVISLDCFLGDTAKWRPRLPDYMLCTYQPDCIAAKVIAALSFYFNVADGEDNTLLHDMLYQGKGYYFMKVLLPNTPEGMLLGYSPTQMEDIIANRCIVWQHFIDQELWYSTNYRVKNQYLAPRPFTGEIGPGCPGRIGAWLGFEIIKGYMKHHPEVRLPELMQNTNVQHMFTQARYRP